MAKTERSKRILFLSGISIILILGAIIAAVIVTGERKKADDHSNDQSSQDLINNPNISNISNASTVSAFPFGRDRNSGLFSSEGTAASSELEASITGTTDGNSGSGPSKAEKSNSPATLTSSVSAIPRATESCKNPRIRKEWRDLSTQEQLEYLAAVNGLFKKPSLKGYDNRHMDFVKAHIENKHLVHNTTIFMPWHRHFIFEYEKELRSINPKVSLPYWDWGMDYEDPDKSPLFDDNAFGGSGDKTTHCINSGAFAGIRTQFYEGHSDPHCVKRDFTLKNTVTTLTAPSVMMGLALYKEFEKFSYSFEGLPHALAHNFISGDMITNQSPSDPMFYLVHGNVDRYFSIWQEEHPDSKFPGSLEDKLPAYDTPLSVPFKLPRKSSDYCYSYSNKAAQTHRKRELEPIVPSKNHTVLYPSKVPVSFTKMMGGSPKKIQTLQNQSTKFIDCLNRIGFVSPAVSYASDRHWKKYRIEKGSSSRFKQGTISRQHLERCLPLLIS